MSLHNLTHGWRRYAILLAALLLAVGLYVLFRLVASHTNTVFMASNDDFAYAYAVIVWPSYVLLATGLVFFASGALGFSLVVDVFTFVLLLVSFEQGWNVDRILGLKDIGQTGFLTMAEGGNWNTTWRSQALCMVALWLGLIIGKAIGLFMHRRISRQALPESPRRAADWRVVAAHVLNAGFAAPALAYACGVMVIAGPMDDPDVKTAGDACVYLTIMAIGYAAGTAFSLAFSLRGRGLSRPGRAAWVASALAALLICGWSWAAHSAGGWHGARLAALCAFSFAVIVAFAVITHWRFGRMQVADDQAVS